MARPIQEIYDEIVAQKSATPELDALSSNSTTAIWRLWAFVTATIIHYHEKKMDTFRAEIIKINQENEVGRADWYVKKAREFQYGDNLEVIDNLLTYRSIDVSKQIIKRAAYSQSGTSTLIKVATTDSTGIKALSAVQMTAFTDYMHTQMLAGSNISIQSADTDYMKLVANIYYQPSFFVNTVKTDVVTAINNCLASLPFDASLKKNALIDAIQAVAGVSDVEITTVQVRTNTGAFADMGRTYTPFAGYIQIDPAFALDANLTMLV